jgi:hypothetical protein
MDCDNWVVIKMKGDEPHYRVLAGWSGVFKIVNGEFVNVE